MAMFLVWQAVLLQIRYKQIQTCLFVYVESIYILPLSKIDLKELTTKAMCPEKENNQSQGSEDLA